VSLSLAASHRNGIRNRQRSKQDAVQGFGGIEEGWAKFFIYNPTSYVMTKENVRFFQNKGFEEQKKKVFDPTKFDDKGPIDIPSRESFYAVLFPKQLYILGSRRD